ncbi:MAG: efflux RND transporter periplasmic adaptor subunit [Oscillochloris sp.]|nr:efflux RND transporter periplasmic adaptor subunit [Oscillochloris sp.]
MASTASPRKRARNGRRIAIIVGIVLLAIIVVVAGSFFFAPQGPEAGTLPEGWTTVQAERGSIASTVSATGNIEPAAEANLRFSTSGTVAEILVKPGDEVVPGQPLARIDSDALELRIEQAEADLRQANADYEALLVGATPAEVAEAEARIEQARRQYAQAAANVSQADIAAARSDLETARARLAELQSGPESAELASANEQVQRAQATLDQGRVDLSAAKERARLDMESRANALRNAQEEYSKIYWDNRELDRLPGDLPQERVDQETQALRGVSDAEAALEQTRLAYEQAKQNEINTLQQYQASLESAIASRDKLLAGPKADELAAARAEVQRAQANLDNLTGAGRNSDLAVQESGIELAEIGLDRLQESPNSATLASREAGIARAEVALRSAQRDLAEATLMAPFAATIADVKMQVGEPADTGAIIALVDLSSFHIDLPVDELDIAAIAPDQRAEISLDALPDAEIGGVVTAIAPNATRSDQGTTTYEVTVTLDENAPGVRPGMTAVVEIVTAERTDTILLPRRAVRSEGGQSYVLIPTGGEPTVTGPGQVTPASERRAVTLGFSNAELVEILDGIVAGEEVLVQDVVSTFLPGGGPPN